MTGSSRSPHEPQCIELRTRCAQHGDGQGAIYHGDGQGVFNMVMGTGPECGERLATHPKVPLTLTLPLTPTLTSNSAPTTPAAFSHP